MCSAGVSLEIAPFASRAEESLRRTDANVASLAACMSGLLSLFAVVVSTAMTDAAAANRKKRVARVLCILQKHYDSTSMISKLDWISTVGRSVAATLQYLFSESSIACAT